MSVSRESFRPEARGDFSRHELVTSDRALNRIIRATAES
jgi:hypothetical protein